MDATARELAASLALLTAALDDPDADLAAEVVALAAHAHTVVDSYLGLTVVVVGDSSATLTSFAGRQSTMSDIQASVRIPLLDNNFDGASVEFILYARKPGAFVDLAADLTWLSGREFEVDQHLQLPSASEGNETLPATSLINQAIGVLMGRGSTPAAALRELDSLASSNAIARVDAASRILAAIPAIDPSIE